MELSNIESCFDHLSHVPITQPPPKFPTLAEVLPKRQSKLTTSCQHPDWTKRAQHLANQREESSSESETESDHIQQQWPHYGTDGLYPLGPGGGLGVFPGLLQEQLSSEEDPHEDDPDPGGSPTLRLTPVELAVLMLNLAKNLCYREGIGGPQGMAVSLALLPHLSHFLVALQADISQSNIPEGWDAETMAFVQRYAIRVITTVASHASLQPNGVSSLVASGALLSLLDIAKQNMRRISENSSLDLPDIDSISSPILLADDILYSVWLLLHTVFYSIPLNPTFLSSSLKLLGEVVENQGLHIVQSLLLTWER